tara:strand:+ start:1129 stop:1416 length:288 start_codon:yes stop_codon:yes gene_type:complete
MCFYATYLSHIVDATINIKNTPIPVSSTAMENIKKLAIIFAIVISILFPFLFYLDGGTSMFAKIIIFFYPLSFFIFGSSIDHKNVLGITVANRGW